MAKSTSHKNLLIVDPNPCGSEIVNHEDLSIFVDLKVHRRNDDIILFTQKDENKEARRSGSDEPKKTSSSTTERTTISFIDGDGNTEKVLTTNYTALRPPVLLQKTPLWGYLFLRLRHRIESILKGPVDED